MNRDTKIKDAGMLTRAKNCAYRAIIGPRPTTDVNGPEWDAFKAHAKERRENGTLGDLCKLSRKQMLETKSCGVKTLAEICDTLLRAKLYLNDDTPTLWENDRSRITEEFVKCAETEPDTIVRFLCNNMSIRELVQAATAAGLDKETKDHGEGKETGTENEDAGDDEGLPAGQEEAADTEAQESR